MNIHPSTTVHDLLEEYPFLLNFLADYTPKFEILRNKAMRETMGRMAKLSMAAEMGGVPLDKLMADIAAEIERRTGDAVTADGRGDAGSTDGNAEKLERLKNIIRGLHRGDDSAVLKAEFDRLMGEIEPTQIAVMEEQLIREGMPAEEIQRLCDLHVSVFRDALDSRDSVKAPSGHPVHTFMEENARFSEIVSAFDKTVQAIAAGDSSSGLMDSLRALLDKLARLDTHYLRKENQLFPFLEKHGVTGPTQVMWGIHDEIRAMIKALAVSAASNDTAAVTETGPKISRAVVEMIYKENSILFPMAMDTLSEEEWREIRSGEDEVGYAFVKPGAEWPGGGTAGESASAAATGDGQGAIGLDTGALTPEQINLMLKHLPVELSYVDENDTVRYYSGTEERIFPRSPGVIGRTVQKCHPPKSVHIVERILAAFKSGKKNSADFHIGMNGRMIRIAYYAVRDSKSVYRGTIEVTQDVTDIVGLSGEKRLLDWDADNG